jgi:hypothetical protein
MQLHFRVLHQTVRNTVVQKLVLFKLTSQSVPVLEKANLIRQEGILDKFQHKFGGLIVTSMLISPKIELGIQFFHPRSQKGHTLFDFALTAGDRNGNALTRRRRVKKHDFATRYTGLYLMFEWLDDAFDPHGAQITKGKDGFGVL